MKLLVRGTKTAFREAMMKDGELKPTGIEVDPASLVHFGTDVVGMDGGFGLPRVNIKSDYLARMDRMGVDYILVSDELERVEHAQSGKNLVALTAYLVRR